MAKKNLDALLGGYRPKAKDEQRFVDKHVVQKHEDRNGNGDDVFKASKVKYIEREGERHGYDHEKGIEVYEDEQLDESLGNKNHSKFVSSIKAKYNFETKPKIDIERYKDVTVHNTKWPSKNGKDYHLATSTVNHKNGEVLHRFFKAGSLSSSSASKSKLNEDEQLDEISKETLSSYRTKAKMDKAATKADLEYDRNRKGFDSAAEASRKRSIKKAEQTLDKRNRGLASLKKRGIDESNLDFINQVLDNLRPEEMVSIEEELIMSLDWLPEAHVNLMLDIFDNLSEENQDVLIKLAQDPSKHDELLDFAIEVKGDL